VRLQRIASRGHDPETFVVVFDKGDQVVAGLTEAAKRAGWGASQLTAIGGFRQATIGYFDRDRKEYRKIPVEEQVEVLSLLGDLILEDGEPKVHAHVVLGRSDGSTVGGHLLEGDVWPTLEVVLTEAPGSLRKRLDPETGLALIDLDGTG
jgi:predicted DNA-binding protein with PD1-like motif